MSTNAFKKEPAEEDMRALAQVRGVVALKSRNEKN